MELLKRMKSKNTFYNLMAIVLAVCILFVCISPALAGSETTDVLSKVGSKGEEVEQIQQALKDQGYYDGEVDGAFGTQTKNAVLQFQRDNGLSADGIVGPQTLLKLGITENSGDDSGSGSDTSSGGAGGFSDSDIQLLARLINGEARGESYTGQVAVGAVVLNRVQHPSFPDTISGVIYQPGAFSCTKDSNWSAAVSESAQKAALDCANGWDPSGGAIFFYNAKKTSNSFLHGRPTVTVIGNHTFAK